MSERTGVFIPAEEWEQFETAWILMVMHPEEEPFAGLTEAVRAMRAKAKEFP